MAEQAAAQQSIAKDPDATKRVVRQLEMSRLRLAENERAVHVITAFDDTEPEDLLDPSYWAHVTSKFTPWDHIEARANDGAWWAEYIVLSVDRAFARVAMLRKVNLTTPDVALSQATGPQAHEVKFRGPHSKWSVIRNSDKQVLFEGGALREDAEGWLRNHLKAFR